MLKDAGLVSDRADGNRRVYQVETPALAELRRYLEGFWDEVLEAYRRAAEAPDEPRSEAASDTVVDLRKRGAAKRPRDGKGRWKMTAEAETLVAPVVRSVRVACSQERAFRVFTEDTATWWPLKTHSTGEDRAESVSIEPRVGGLIIETMQGGETSEWGSVLAWEPFDRLVIEWRVKPEKPATEIEITFTPDGDGTVVRLEHRHWERLRREGRRGARRLRRGLAGPAGRLRGGHRDGLRTTEAGAESKPPDAGTSEAAAGSRTAAASADTGNIMVFPGQARAPSQRPSGDRPAGADLPAGLPCRARRIWALGAASSVPILDSVWRVVRGRPREPGRRVGRRA